jgi:hypothetical protein
MSALTLQIASPWTICTPTLFRFLDRQYVDEFFDSGALRLSSFSQFAKHEDEARHDPAEGKAMFVNRTTEGTGQTLMALTRHGANACVLSASMRHDPDLMRAFNADSCILIKDSLNFGAAISRSVPGFVGGLEGPCLYQSTGIIEGALPPFDLEKFRDPASGLIHIDQIVAAAQSEMGPLPFFIKDKRYAYQSEYRLIWITESPVPDYLHVTVPAARQFCRRASELMK